MRSSRMHQWVRVAAILAVAVPAIGIALLAFREGATESGGVSFNRGFHLILGATLVLLFVDFLTAIHRSGGIGMTIALGLGGFVCSLVGAVLSEMFGPPALRLLLAGAATWALVLVRTMSNGRAELAFEQTARSEHVQAFEYDGRIEVVPVRSISSKRGFLAGIDSTVERDEDRV